MCVCVRAQRDVNTAGFKPNLQTNLAPVLATAVKAQLGLTTTTPAAAAAPDAAPSAANGTGSKGAAADAPASAKHHALLLELLSSQLGVAPSSIVDFELHVCDVQPGMLGGARDEFVFAGRLDNLAMSYVALQVGDWGAGGQLCRGTRGDGALDLAKDAAVLCVQSLIDSTSGAGALAEETGVRSVALFDHEEVGSDSAQVRGSDLRHGGWGAHRRSAFLFLPVRA